MNYLAIIKDASPQFGGDTTIACASRHDAVTTARKECLAARAIGVECYASVLPKRRVRPEKDFRRLGWIGDDFALKTWAVSDGNLF